MECIYILAGRGGGIVSNTEQSCVKTPGCTMYRSLYGSVWFGLVAYKMIYHNSGLIVLKCLNLVRCVVISMSVQYRG